MTYDLPKVISTSQINTYRHCPKKYFFQYIMKIPVETKSPWLELGSKVHERIAKRDFVSSDLMIRIMLRNAQKFLNNMPPNPIMETTYEDKNNPGRFFGDILGRRAIGIFDYHWIDYPMAGDWKTGKFDQRFTDSLEIQSYILSELYRQKYDFPLKRFYFNFIKFGITYKAICITDEDVRSKIESNIRDALIFIEEGHFPRKRGILCNYCDYAKDCQKDSDLIDWNKPKKKS